MSSSRSRAQKHQNRTAFKPDLYGCNKRVSEAKTLAFGGVCTRCKDQIEWKKSFAKYKPLTAPRKCTECTQKTVKHAYHRICMPCVLKNQVCGKCGKKETIVESYPQTPAEQAKEEATFKEGLRALSERERRSLLRSAATGGNEGASERKRGSDCCPNVNCSESGTNLCDACSSDSDDDSGSDAAAMKMILKNDA